MRRASARFVPDEAGMIALGRRLGRKLRGLDVVCLEGELGAGKTTMTKGIAAALGFRGRVASPTFALAREYRGRRWTIHHVDLYRVSRRETGDIGLEEFLSDPRGVCVIEWPEAGLDYLPKDRLLVRLRPRRGGRLVSLRGLGPRSRRLAAGLG
ncbi:MAG: tRNA (adenosine(37)-N6)-threonylcarbamoyltransferase complex ATPase subunit type 1 TsaE [Elusimicrobia bacterium]|nr:tRNA (adenosine(37)-N6)-threonylcarbamoyltransferase complex ATPase subunit type 1 TsaE [Elusimicrobiota bacterium]MDE2236766.1 tRNA (adenosine(37)-N6)-threonylcarbamoyltransferase complex ATPase subunit type 1 TsaE [Elusimicrobiota bacterium]MDE2425091.1 tRNA (adenosine(37)-N6)-threonylcarbamoyltransferase complex ATPase subunit type 1 TsaE [Elusimicrobiota bacterium]